jgi:hypothetical protein
MCAHDIYLCYFLNLNHEGFSHPSVTYGLVSLDYLDYYVSTVGYGLTREMVFVPLAKGRD